MQIAIALFPRFTALDAGSPEKAPPAVAQRVRERMALGEQRVLA